MIFVSWNWYDNSFLHDMCLLFGRRLAQAIAMTACDLCASVKPWDIQVQTVKVIFEEFYAQVYLPHSNIPTAIHSDIYTCTHTQHQPILHINSGLPHTSHKQYTFQFFLPWKFPSHGSQLSSQAVSFPYRNRGLRVHYTYNLKHNTLGQNTIKVFSYNRLHGRTYIRDSTWPGSLCIPHAFSYSSQFFPISQTPLFHSPLRSDWVCACGPFSRAAVPIGPSSRRLLDMCYLPTVHFSAQPRNLPLTRIIYVMTVLYQLVKDIPTEYNYFDCKLKSDTIRRYHMSKAFCGFFYCKWKATFLYVTAMLKM